MFLTSDDISPYRYLLVFGEIWALDQTAHPAQDHCPVFEISSTKLNKVLTWSNVGQKTESKLLCKMYQAII